MLVQASYKSLQAPYKKSVTESESQEETPEPPLTRSMTLLRKHESSTTKHENLIIEHCRSFNTWRMLPHTDKFTQV